MAHARQEFALVGYSNDLERRLLKFVEPIPPSRICSACGNVPRSTYALLCGHSLCESCYVDCATTSVCACPLDGEVFAPADVTRMEYPAENLLRRKVLCWNEGNGCGVVLPASQVAEHVRHDCRYHVIRCPSCLATVLSRDVCAHLRSRCTSLLLNAAPGALARADDDERTHLETFEQRVEQRVRELNVKLDQLSLISDCLSDQVVEILDNDDHLKEVVTKHFGPGLGRQLAEMKVLHAEKIESLCSALTSAVAPVPSDSKTHQRVITGYAGLKEKALRDGWCNSWSDRVYLRRYLMSWGIEFKKEGDNVDIFLLIQLHEGREDDFIDWPFTNELKLSIIHPETRQESHHSGKPYLCEENKKFLSRPIQGSNQTARFDTTRVESSNLERDGYVKGDQLLIRLEVLI